MIITLSWNVYKNRPPNIELRSLRNTHFRYSYYFINYAFIYRCNCRAGAKVRRDKANRWRTFKGYQSSCKRYNTARGLIIYRTQVIICDIFVPELNEKRITDCSKVDSENSTTANISRKTFAIFTGKRKIAVSCDRSTDGGRWTVSIA